MTTRNTTSPYSVDHPSLDPEPVNPSHKFSSQYSFARNHRLDRYALVEVFAGDIFGLENKIRAIRHSRGLKSRRSIPREHYTDRGERRARGPRDNGFGSMKAQNCFTAWSSSTSHQRGHATKAWFESDNYLPIYVAESRQRGSRGIVPPYTSPEQPDDAVRKSRQLDDNIVILIRRGIPVHIYRIASRGGRDE